MKKKLLWDKLRQYLSQFINIPHFTPQSSIVGIFDNNQHSLLINYFLPILKFYFYSARNTKQVKFDNLKKILTKIKDPEKALEKDLKCVQSCVFIVNFEHYSHLFPVFLVFTLNREMLAELVVRRLLEKIFYNLIPVKTCCCLSVLVSVVVSVSIDFSSNSKGDTLLHRTAYDFSC